MRPVYLSLSADKNVTYKTGDTFKISALKKVMKQDTAIPRLVPRISAFQHLSESCQLELSHFYHHYTVSTGHALIKLNAAATSWFQAETATIQVSCFYCFCGTILDSYWTNLVAHGSESCSSTRETGSDRCVQLY